MAFDYSSRPKNTFWPGRMVKIAGYGPYEVTAMYPDGMLDIEFMPGRRTTVATIWCVPVLSMEDVIDDWLTYADDDATLGTLRASLREAGLPDRPRTKDAP